MIRYKTYIIKELSPLRRDTPPFQYSITYQDRSDYKDTFTIIINSDTDLIEPPYSLTFRFASPPTRPPRSVR